MPKLNSILSFAALMLAAAFLLACASVASMPYKDSASEPNDKPYVEAETLYGNGYLSDTTMNPGVTTPQPNPTFGESQYDNDKIGYGGDAASSATDEPTGEEPLLITQIPLRTATFAFSDNDDVSVDLNYDGSSESVCISKNNDGRLTLFIDEIASYELGDGSIRLICAYITDFNYLDGSAEIVVSCSTDDDCFRTLVFGGFNARDMLYTAEFDGWLESLTGDCEMKLCRKVELLGTRGASRSFTFNTADKVFVPKEDAWQIHSYGQCAVNVLELTVEAARSDGSPVNSLLPGTRLLPYCSDFESYIAFVTEDSEIDGKIIVRFQNGRCLLENGEDINNYFSALPSW